MLTTRTLGSQGLSVSAIGLGLMGMSQAYGTSEERDERESIATIHRAIELGVTFLDTAEAYGPYQNEELLARALKELEGAREHVVIATKFGFKFDANGVTSGMDSAPEHIRRSGRRLAAPAPDRSHRPALPAPRRPRRAGRGDGGRDGRPRARGQGPLRRVTPGQIALAWLLHKGPDIVRSPAPNGGVTWRRTSARRPCHSALARWPRSTRRSRQRRWPGRATARS